MVQVTLRISKKELDAKYRLKILSRIYAIYNLVYRQQSAGVPITFLLGFYVHLITRRWWEQVTNQRPGYGHVTRILTNQRPARGHVTSH